MVVNIFFPLYMKTAKSVTIQNIEVTFQSTSLPIAMCAVIFVCATLYLQNNTFTSVSSEYAAPHKAGTHNAPRQLRQYCIALHHGSFPDARRLRRLSPVRPTFQLIRPSQFRGFPPGTAQPPARLIGSFVPSCFAEQRQNKRKCCSGTIVSTLVSKDKGK